MSLLSALTQKKIIIRAFALTTLIEVITIILRFGFKLESTRDGASTIGVLSMGWRIHHGYVGLALIFYALLRLKDKPLLYSWLLAIGIGLFASDMIHHFVVLWPLVGSPEFHFQY